MSTERDTGGPAFPSMTLHEQVTMAHHQLPTYLSQAFPGMSLRDHFAGLAMQGMLASNAQGMLHAGGKQEPAKLMVAAAFEIADAMLKAREA